MGKSAGMPDEAAQGRGHGRAALDAPQRQPVPLQLRLVRRGEQSVAAFSLLLQSALYLRSAAGLTPLQHLHQAALLLLRASAFAAFTFMPHEAWLRWRVWIIGAFRLAIAQLPSQRRAGEGDAVLLDCAASPGGVGLLRDWLRFLMGTRLLPMAVVGAVLQQPPLAVLVQQVLLISLSADITSDTAGFCASQLATDPLSTARFAAAADALDALTPLGTPLLKPADLDLAAAPAGSAAGVRCAALMVLHQCLVGVALPVLVAAFAGASPANLAPLNEASEQQQQQQHGSVCLHAARRTRLLRAACRGVSRAAANLNAALRACCRGASLPMQCVAAYLLLAHFWTMAKAVAMRSAANS